MITRFGVPERRARLGVRHRLAPGAAASDPVEVARALVAVHGTDPSSVYLGLLARMAGGGIESVEQALYQDRTLIRLLGMRRTVFVAPLDTAALIQAACSRAVAARERRKLVSWLAESGVDGDPDAWLADVEQAALRALTARGEATAAELADDDPRLRTQIVLARGKSYEGRQNVSSRVLFLLAAQGQVVRGRPRGSWTSHQYRWVPLSRWSPDGLADWPAAAAEVELARRWLRAYGPATVEDLRWWTGWGKTQASRVLTELKPAEVELDGQPGIVLADDLEPAPDPGANRSRGRRCFRRWTPPRWAGSSGRGSSASTGRGCSTGPATSAPACGGTAGSSAAGRRTGTARSSAGSWKMPAPRPPPPRTQPPGAWPPCSAVSGWPPGPAARPGSKWNSPADGPAGGLR